MVRGSPARVIRPGRDRRDLLGEPRGEAPTPIPHTPGVERPTVRGDALAQAL
jgi:hypothetical protein